MAVSKAQKAATAKYEAKAYDKILVRLPRGKKAEIEKAAKSSGESINGFINRAIDETITDAPHDVPQRAADGVLSIGNILTPEMLKTAQEAAQNAGETTNEFVERAVKTQAQRDGVARMIQKKPGE